MCVNKSPVILLKYNLTWANVRCVHILIQSEKKHTGCNWAIILIAKSDVLSKTCKIRALFGTDLTTCMARWKHHVCIFSRMHSLFVVTIFVNFLVVKSYFDHANHHVLNFSIFDCRRDHTSLASTTLYYLWDFKLLTDSKIYMAGEEARY